LWPLQQQQQQIKRGNFFLQMRASTIAALSVGQIILKGNFSSHSISGYIGSATPQIEKKKPGKIQHHNSDLIRVTLSLAPSFR
jgi:hypothetical protein